MLASGNPDRIAAISGQMRATLHFALFALYLLYAVLLYRSLAKFGYKAGQLVGKEGLEKQYEQELRGREYAPRVSEDVASADESGVTGTPTFFINGRRHYGVYDIDTLSEAVRAAKNRARSLSISSPAVTGA